MAVPVRNSDLVVKQPVSAQDFEIYFILRHEVLRKPWNQPLGSERDTDEKTSVHAFIKENNKALAVARLQFLDKNTSQVRYMAVDPNQQGRGLGKMVLEYLEKKSAEAGRKKVVLHARENALKFYERCGYTIVEKSHLLWGKIQHWLMEKELD
ncbi:MAG TPA: GNAT family N-acetyltransferase [Bacteroidia bacterium]|nr:GNAT family N-acetyltransferase [Bacteroidia bacterium]